jgi:hypothetical protein
MKTLYRFSTVYALLCASCVLPGSIPAASTRPTVYRLLDRHDAYVAADSSLVDTDRRLALRDSELIRLVFVEAGKADQ